VEGTRYERLYTRADAEPVFLYWHIEWIGPDTDAGSSGTPLQAFRRHPDQRRGPSLLVPNSFES